LESRTHKSKTAKSPVAGMGECTQKERKESRRDIDVSWGLDEGAVVDAALRCGGGASEGRCCPCDTPFPNT
jgi:hypothetical protein